LLANRPPAEIIAELEKKRNAATNDTERKNWQAKLNMVKNYRQQEFRELQRAQPAQKEAKRRLRRARLGQAHRNFEKAQKNLANELKIGTERTKAARWIQNWMKENPTSQHQNKAQQNLKDAEANLANALAGINKRNKAVVLARRMRKIKEWIRNHANKLDAVRPPTQRIQYRHVNGKTSKFGTLGMQNLTRRMSRMSTQNRGPVRRRAPPVLPPNFDEPLKKKPGPSVVLNLMDPNRAKITEKSHPRFYEGIRRLPRKLLPKKFHVKNVATTGRPTNYGGHVDLDVNLRREAVRRRQLRGNGGKTASLLNALRKKGGIAPIGKPSASPVNDLADLRNEQRRRAAKRKKNLENNVARRAAIKRGRNEGRPSKRSPADEEYAEMKKKRAKVRQTKNKLKRRGSPSDSMQNFIKNNSSASSVSRHSNSNSASNSQRAKKIESNSNANT
jgi:hypothetical protein